MRPLRTPATGTNTGAFASAIVSAIVSASTTTSPSVTASPITNTGTTTATTTTATLNSWRRQSLALKIIQIVAPIHPPADPVHGTYAVRAVVTLARMKPCREAAAISCVNIACLSSPRAAPGCKGGRARERKKLDLLVAPPMRVEIQVFRVPYGVRIQISAPCDYCDCRRWARIRLVSFVLQHAATAHG